MHYEVTGCGCALTYLAIVWDARDERAFGHSNLFIQKTNSGTETDFND